MHSLDYYFYLFCSGAVCGRLTYSLRSQSNLIRFQTTTRTAHTESNHHEFFFLSVCLFFATIGNWISRIDSGLCGCYLMHIEPNFYELKIYSFISLWIFRIRIGQGREMKKKVCSTVVAYPSADSDPCSWPNANWEILQTFVYLIYSLSLPLFLSLAPEFRKKFNLSN